MKPVFFFTERNLKYGTGIFLQDFIVLTVCIISVHFRYIYSTNFTCGRALLGL